MRRIVSLFKSLLNLLGLGLLGALVVTVRYMLKTPQPLDSALPGEARLYKWKHGHIFYALSGSPASPPLVLLHDPEVGGSSYEMRNIVAELSQHYQVYALDLLGFGLSDRPTMSYAASTYIGLYKDFLSDVVGRPATLLASGRSANHAVAVASQAPEVCERLLLLSPASLFDLPEERPWLTYLLQQPLLAIALYAFLSTPFALRRIIARKHAQDYSQIEREDFEHYFAAAHQLGAQHAPLAALAGALDIDVSAQYEHLTQPSLIIWGLRNLEGKPQLVQQDSRSKQAKLIFIQGAGAHVHEDRPTEVVASILSWQAEEQPAPIEQVSPGFHIAKNGPVEEQTSSLEVEEVEVPEQVAGEASSEANRSGEVSFEASQPGEASFEANQSGEVSFEASQLDEVPFEANQPDKESLPAELVSREMAGSERAGEAESIEAYCVKCRQKRFMQNPQAIVTKNGRHAMEGICPVCGTRLFRFVAG